MVKEEILTLLNGVKRPGINKLVEWLDSAKSDYFTAPASTMFHGNYEGALAEHSFNVYTLLKEKNERYNLGLSEDTIILTGLLHDACKINFYKKGKKNVKDGKKINAYGKEVDNWVEKEVWEIDDKLPLGHGEKSIMIIESFIRLTFQEKLMIRWHMGGFEPKENYRTLNAAYEMEKACVAIHTADMEASNILEEKRN